MNWRGLPLLVLTSVGCSLLIPLDYTGGKQPSHANRGGGAGVVAETGGSVLGGEGGREDAASGGTGAESESGMGGGGAPGAAGEGTGGGESGGSGGSGAVGAGGTGGGSGGDVTVLGGTGGDGSGRGGDGGTAGTANAGGAGGTSGSDGGAGRGGSAGGGGVSGGTSGMSGAAGMAGMAGCTFDLDNDAMHCGSCTNACDEGVKCEGGQCITAPCVGICAPSTIVPLKPSDGYRVEPVPKAGGCFEVPSYTPTSGLPAIVCWNFVNRTLEVNAGTTACTNGSGAPLPLERAGGYCVKVGPTADTCSTCPGFVLPLSSSLH